MKQFVKDLTTQDLHHLRAAEGWMELGDLISACDELDEMTAEARANPVVLSLRYSIYAKAKRWDMAWEIANGLTAMVPDEPATWINLAYATRRRTGGSIEEAKRILLVARVKFPRDYIFPFSLACYCSQLGQLREAEKWLKKAMAIDEKTVQKLAVEDEDLKPLWDSMSGTLWKKE